MTSPQPPLALTLPGGEAAQVLFFGDGDKTSIQSPFPAPPGSLVRGRFDGISCEFQLKVRGCHKEGTVFVIEGRLQNATRELKRHLAAIKS